MSASLPGAAFRRRFPSLWPRRVGRTGFSPETTSIYPSREISGGRRRHCRGTGAPTVGVDPCRIPSKRTKPLLTTSVRSWPVGTASQIPSSDAMPRRLLSKRTVDLPAQPVGLKISFTGTRSTFRVRRPRSLHLVPLPHPPCLLG